MLPNSEAAQNPFKDEWSYIKNIHGEGAISAHGPSFHHAQSMVTSKHSNLSAVDKRSETRGSAVIAHSESSGAEFASSAKSEPSNAAHHLHDIASEVHDRPASPAGSDAVSHLSAVLDIAPSKLRLPSPLPATLTAHPGFHPLPATQEAKPDHHESADNAQSNKAATRSTKLLADVLCL